MTIYAILLNDYQQADGNYHVCASGTLAECRAQTTFDGRDDPWPKSEYDEVSSEPTSLTTGLGKACPGQIVGLRPVAAARVAAGDARHGRPRRASLVALGVALGMALGRGARSRAPRRRR